MEEKIKKYSANLSNYLRFDEEIIFYKMKIKKLPKEKLDKEEIKGLGVFDCKNYNLTEIKSLCQ